MLRKEVKNIFEYIINGIVFLDGKFHIKTIGIQDGVMAVLDSGTDLPEDAVVYDAKGCKVVPGFIDIHTHGAVRADVNAATAEGLEQIGRFMAKNGTTSWLCSISPDTEQETLSCMEQFKKYKMQGNSSASLLGIHLEGPFLAKQYKGAMPEHLLREPDLKLLCRYQEKAEGYIKYITIAPEIEGIIEMIPSMNELGS